jgi:hypothetical protein
MLKRALVALALVACAFVTTGLIVTPEVVMVDTTSDLQTAVDNLDEGCTLRLGPGEYTVPSGGLVISKPIAIEGISQPADFYGTWVDSTALDMGTVLHPYAQGEPIILIDPDSSYGGQAQMSVRFENLVLDGDASVRAVGGYGIFCQRDSGVTAGDKVIYSALRNVTIHHTGDDGIRMTRDTSTAGLDRAVVGLSLQNTNVRSCYGYGLYLEDATVVSLRDCQFQNNSYYGARFYLCGVTLDNCGFESNCRDSVDGAYYDAQLHGYDCNRFNVLNCHFENFDGAPRSSASYTGRKGIYANSCNNLVISGCLFVNGAYDDIDPPTPITWYTYPDPSTSEAIHLVSCEDYNIGANKYLRCYIGLGVQKSGSDEAFRPGRVDPQQTYDFDGYGCFIPYYQVAGTRVLAMDTTYVFAYPPQGVASSFPAAGVMFFDTTGVAAGGDGKLVIWTGTKWQSVDMTLYRPVP